MLDPKPTPLPSATPETGSSDQNQVPDQQRLQRGTGFTNISRILNANKGAGERMGQTIGTGISNQAGQVRQGLQQGQSQFVAGVQKGSQDANQAIANGQSLYQQAGEMPDQYSTRLAKLQSPDLEKQGQQLQNATYKGPTELENANKYQSQAANASALGKLAGTAGGQAQLLRTQVAQRGNYTQGQNSLDQLLLGKGGQTQIQQGRQSVAGLPQQTENTIQNAANQANAASSAIENKRVDTLHNVQNQLTGDKGFTQLAKQQADQFNADAARLAQLVRGTDDQGKTITDKDISAHDKDLLQHPEDYGIDNSDLYIKNNQDDVNKLLGQLSGTLTQNFGASRYMGDQSGAAQNLASFLGQNDIKTQIANNKFNTDLFGADQKALFTPLDDLKKQHEATRDKLVSYSNDLGQMQDYMMKKSNDDLKARLSSVDSMNVSDLQKSVLKQLIQQESSGEQNDIQHGATALYQQQGTPGMAKRYWDVTKVPEYEKLAQDPTYINNINDQMNQINSAQSDYSDLPTTGIIGRPLGAASADPGQVGAEEAVLGPNYRQAVANMDMNGFIYDIMSRHGQNMGDPTANAQHVMEVANQQVGPEQKLNEYVLNRLLGNNQG